MNNLIMNKKSLAILAITLFLVVGVTPAIAVPPPTPTPITKDYSDITVTSPPYLSNFNEVWDLTRCDLNVTYHLDMSSAVGGWKPIEVGMKQVGDGSIDPAHGIYLWSDYQNPQSNRPNNIDLNDHHVLGGPGWDARETWYNATGPASNPTIHPTPFGSGNNFHFWFDRGGVDQWQDDQWDMIHGGYNTLGIYDIVLAYHAVPPTFTLGTAFAEINGWGQGFPGFPTAPSFPPTYYPAGRSFSSSYVNLAQMQFFVGVYDKASLSDISVTGCLAQYQLTISVSPTGGGTTDPAVGTYTYDWGTSVSVTATAASGYMFDSWLIDGSSTDPANPITVTMNAAHTLVAQFLSAEAIKQRVLQQLTELKVTVTNKADVKLLGEAIEHLTRSLTPSLWVDETHLNPKTGVKVFLEEEAAVASLLMLKLLPKSTVDKATLQGFIDRLVAADKLLASAAISGASGSSPVLLRLANSAVAKGDQLAKAGKYVAAMQQYCNAWLIVPKKK